MTLETGAVTQYESRSFLVPGGGFEVRSLGVSVRAGLPGFLAGGLPLDAPSQARFQLGCTQVLSSYGFPPRCSLFLALSVLLLV